MKKGIATIKIITISVLLAIAVVLGLWLAGRIIYHSTSAGPPTLTGPLVTLTPDNTVTLKFMYGSGTISAGDWQYSAWSDGTQIVPWTPGEVSIAPENETELPACTIAVNNGTLSVGDTVKIEIPDEGTLFVCPIL